MRRLLLVLVAACGGARTPPAQTEPVSPELSPALAPLAWWLGDWQSGADCDGSPVAYREHWVAASGAMYGVGFSDRGFEVMIVDDGEGGGPPDGVLRFIAMPMGERSVEFKQRELGDRTITFANPEHDDPKQITYAKHDDQLRAVLFGTSFIKVDMCPTAGTSAPELEAADRAFAADTAARHVDGWVAAFDPQGAMMSRGTRLEGAQIRTAMEGTLATGTLAWEPIASRRAGTLGFTVGKATYTGPESWRSSYVTVWRQQSDGGWKVLFDTGRVVQE